MCEEKNKQTTAKKKLLYEDMTFSFFGNVILTIKCISISRRAIYIFDKATLVGCCHSIDSES